MKEKKMPIKNDAYIWNLISTNHRRFSHSLWVIMENTAYCLAEMASQ